MPGPRPALCTFPHDFLQEARDTVGRRTVAVQTVQRFRLVLLLDEQPAMRKRRGGREGRAVCSASTTVAKSLGSRRFCHHRSCWSGPKGHFSPAGSRVGSSDGL